MIRRLPLLPAGYRQLLSCRPYRLYFASSTLGAFASAVQFLAQGWLIVALAPGATALIAYLVVRLGVKALLAVPAGLIADRVPRSQIYAWMRVLAGVSSLVAVGALFSPYPVVVALVATAIAAAAHAFDLPAHRALQGEVQPPEQLERGLSFGSGGFHIASLLAPIIAFPLASWAGAGAPLMLSALVFFAAAAPAFAITPTKLIRLPARAHQDVSSALRYLAGTPAVIALLLATTLPSLVDKAVVIALPSASSAGDHSAFGLVLAAPELGAITIGFVMAALNWRFAPWIPIVSAGGYAAGVTAASFAGLAVGIEMIAIALFLAGCAKTTLITSSFAGIQRLVPAEMRGRIMTI